jgi:alkylated DNA repair dioxygenase AlkB
MFFPEAISLFTPSEADALFARCRDSIPWQRTGKPRSECWMSPDGEFYYYGRVSERYDPHPYPECVTEVETQIRSAFTGLMRLTMNCCFANAYRDERDNLGWHADDSIGMSHADPIFVVSFGEQRAIEFRPISGEATQAVARVELPHGSVLVMPPNFQRNWMHRIAKSSRKAKQERISLTFRTLVLTDEDRRALAENHARSVAEQAAKKVQKDA